MSLALDYGEIIKVLVKDDTLKTLMDIPTSEKTNYGVLVNKYIMQSSISDQFTDDGICRLLVRNSMQTETTNEFVKWNGVIIEVYVPKSKDLMTGFQTRINKISDRLTQLLNRVYINYNKLYFVNSYELPSGSNNFKRYNCKFEYKKVIK
jgi:hypothetical protein